MQRLGSKRPVPLRGAFFVVIGAFALSSLEALSDYGRLVAALWSTPRAERARLGVDEWHNFLNGAGRPDVRRAVREARREGRLGEQVSRLADVWMQVLEIGRRLPEGAVVYLKVPYSGPYFLGTTAWYPRRVDVGSRQAVIKDDATLRAAAEAAGPARREELIARGYTHVVTASGSRLVVIDLGDPTGYPQP